MTWLQTEYNSTHHFYVISSYGMFQSTGEFRRTKEQRNYVFNNCIKKVTLPLKQNIGQLVGGANSCFSSSSSCYKETPSWERSQCIMEKLGNQAAVNLVLFFCGKVQNPEVIKKSVQIMVYQWKSEIVNDCIIRAPGTKLAWTGLSYVLFSVYFKHSKLCS